MADWIMTQAQVHYDTHGKAPSLTILFNFVFCNLLFRFFWRVACFDSKAVYQPAGLLGIFLQRLYEAPHANSGEVEIIPY